VILRPEPTRGETTVWRELIDAEEALLANG
jgi:hypothetical protein